MEMQFVNKFKWFWAWQDEQEENWLREMSKQGFHLNTPGFFGSYNFEVGLPNDYIYRLDFVTSSKKDLDSYLQLFKDANWDHIGNMGGWQYFRTKVQNGEHPEIFNDNESKIQKYRRIIFILLIYFPLFIVNFNVLSKYDSLFISIIRFFFFLLLILFSIGMIFLMKRIGELKKKI